MLIFSQPLEFEWDHGNMGKNIKHRVSEEECEEAFFDPQKRLVKDVLHSGLEGRYILLGQTRNGRNLFVVFTMRKLRIRIISARDLNRRERYLYEETT